MNASMTSLDEFIKNAVTSRVKNVTLSQSLTTIIQIAFVDFLASWNINFIRIMNHFNDEITTAYCADALTHKSVMIVSFYKKMLVAKFRKTKSDVMFAIDVSK